MAQSITPKAPLIHEKTPENYSSEPLKIYIAVYTAGTSFICFGRILLPPAARLLKPLYFCEAVFKEECEEEDGHLPASAS